MSPVAENCPKPATLFKQDKQQAVQEGPLSKSTNANYLNTLVEHQPHWLPN
ncbi:hypothetical protein T01_6962 [Trichinella spiralis]|uniref:Uncharacterized protein n=1 Tax=Trichinella spiralis TaxID=6334 RepID=A0A0V1B2R4_TRISP|nr:hypothetical protein T01_12217 [Trichinella spiralis]KRY31232.1 hypothetical protein T01_6962 [Trichinella spiralis]